MDEKFEKDSKVTDCAAEERPKLKPSKIASNMVLVYIKLEEQLRHFPLSSKTFER